MKIRLGDKYWLNSDPHCYWITVDVVTENGKNAGKVYERRVSGYTPTFEQCVDTFIDYHLTDSQISDFKKLKKEIADLKKEVRSGKVVVERK